MPSLDAKAYRLQIDGAVEHPLSLSLDELRGMRPETRVATLECAGNSRVFLTPQAEGVQWASGAVSTAEWTGVRLAEVLDSAGLHSNVCEIVLEGADRGKPKQKPVPSGEIVFARSVPIDKALAPEVLIAYQMNGQDLSAAHGYPVRAIVPGYYGMASVKWLVHIHAVAAPFRGYWQTTEYAYWAHLVGIPEQRPLSQAVLKAAIAQPGMHETVQANSRYRILGAAWSGGADVTGIEVSADGGESWAEGEFLDPIQRFAWRRWVCEWKIPAQPAHGKGERRRWSEATRRSGCKLRQLCHSPHASGGSLRAVKNARAPFE